MDTRCFLGMILLLFTPKWYRYKLNRKFLLENALVDWNGCNLDPEQIFEPIASGFKKKKICDPKEGSGLIPEFVEVSSRILTADASLHARAYLVAIVFEQRLEGILPSWAQTELLLTICQTKPQSTEPDARPERLIGKAIFLLQNLKSARKLWQQINKEITDQELIKVIDLEMRWSSSAWSVTNQ